MMATEEQAKKDIVAALLALRKILTQGPKEKYPFPTNLGDHHPEVKELAAQIKRALVPHQEAIDPRYPHFADYMDCDILPLTQLPADWETLRWLDQHIEDFGGKPVAGAEGLVTLQQAAAMVSRSKRTLEKHKGEMPLPRVDGGGGRPDEWAWSELRPWLEEKFRRTLPERFPADQFRKD
jgi:hypothetical protein